jgi:hypothetical protein
MPYKNIEDRRAQRKRYLATAEGRAKVYAGNARWAAKNPEHMRELQNSWRRRAQRSGYAKKYYREKICPKRYGFTAPPAPPHCEACGIPFTKTPHIDHDHATGKFRGWLCHHCNHALGNAKDSRDRLQLLINYLARVDI